MPASRFHDGQHGATYLVRALVFGRELRIVGEDDATIAVWKLAEIKAAPDVDPDGAVILTERQSPGVLLIDDAAELDMLRRVGIRLPGQRVWTRGLWVAVVGGFIAVTGLGILVLNALPRWVAAAIPVAWEQRLGAPSEALLTASKTRCTGREGQKALDRLVARLRDAGGIEMPVTISVFDDPMVNAFTLPGGHVLVMHGLIAGASDGPMLAGVIAHELGHVTHRDSTTMLLRSLGFSMLLHMAGFGETGGTAAMTASSLMNLAYTRSAEAAADATAIDLLTKAGLHADGLSRFFALTEQRAASSGAATDWFDTHPSSASRRERTARPETGELPFTDTEWRAVRAMCAR